MKDQNAYTFEECASMIRGVIDIFGDAIIYSKNKSDKNKRELIKDYKQVVACMPRNIRSKMEHFLEVRSKLDKETLDLLYQLRKVE
jgi:hypothetical protein